MTREEDQHIVRSRKQAAEPLPTCSVGEYVKQKIDQLSPNKIVLIDANTDRKITKEQMDREANEIASALLLEFGIESDDRAMFYADDSIEYFIVNLAMMYLGLTTSPCKPANGSWETGKQLADIGGKILIVSSGKLSVLNQMLEDDQRIGPVMAALKLLIILDGKQLPESTRLELANHRNAPTKVVTIDKLLEIGNGKTLSKIPNFPIDNPESTYFTIAFTSGTSGLPKGAIQSHRSIIASIESIQYSFANDILKDSCLGMVYPFGHISGSIFMVACLKFGAQVVMFSNYSDQLYLESIERYRISSISVLPKFATTLYETDYTKLYDLSAARLMMFGGSKLPENLTENLKVRYRVAINDMYGATEFLGGVINQQPDFPYGSVGSPSPNVEMKIVDLDSGVGLPPNRPGEICFRGPNCFLGYLNNPQATAETIDSDGWYHSGDVGYYDLEDRLFITDRIKELIKYKHWSIAPIEIEAFLQTHPTVSVACVIGVRHQTEGYHLRAYVEIAEGGRTPTEQELLDFVKENMGYQKRLNGGVRFIADIPRTIIGKVDRAHFKNLVKHELLTEPAPVD